MIAEIWENSSKKKKKTEEDVVSVSVINLGALIQGLGELFH